MNIRQVQEYLQRIGLKHIPDASQEFLFILQREHLLHVPFENLDIHFHTPITIDTERFFEKIVRKKRGGFCYELNGLFNELLKTSGFETILVSARVFTTAAEYTEEFDHLAIIVYLDRGRFLVDVGFGEFSLTPLRIEAGIEQTDGRDVYRIERSGEEYIVQKKNIEGKWVAEYRFAELARELQDFSAKCKWHQHAPESHFTQNMICSLATGTGRITLTNKKLKITEWGEVKEIMVRDQDEFKQLLADHFEITM